MNTYLALIRMNLRLSFRDRGVIFFNYLFPLIFFFTFAQMMKAEQTGLITQVVNMVLTIGVLGSGLWGQGMRTVSDREQNILRRFKVAPITPVPILVASIVVGLIHFVPVIFLILGIAHFGYGMALPDQPLSLFTFIAAGLLAFRGVGLIAASVVNSMQESQILIQILYMPMMFLSGATIPIAIMPQLVQVLSQFLPATHLFTGMQSILLGHETLSKNLTPMLALLTTAVVGTFIGSRLFRWEKGEKLQSSAKLWVIAVMLPFIGLGIYQAYSKDNLAKIKSLDRTLDRSGSYLIKDARIIVGDGTVIESGSVLIRRGKIEEIYTGPAPDAKILKASEIQAAGKTVIPALIDIRVDLKQPGGVFDSKDKEDAKPQEIVERELAAYLYSGVAALANASGDFAELRAAVTKLSNGERLGAEAFPAPDYTKIYVPSLAAIEGTIAWRDGRGDPINRSLVQQVGPASLLKGTKAALGPHKLEHQEISLEEAQKQLKAAFDSGKTVVTGTGSGGYLTFHGPAIHRELQLWVQAGVPAKAALQAATGNGAKTLKIDNRTGLIRKGYDATVLVLDGNPLEDIASTERISNLIFKGERIRRPDLFDQK